MSEIVISFPSGRPPKPRALPLRDELQPTILRLKEIATQAADAFLTEGSVHPDRALLDLCGDALYLIRAAAALDGLRLTMPFPHPGHPVREMWDRLRDESEAKIQQATQLLGQAKKLRATTAAGIYTKALIVRAGAPGAHELAISLAEDLIASPGLRASLWPADAGVGA